MGEDVSVGAGGGRTHFGYGWWTLAGCTSGLDGGVSERYVGLKEIPEFGFEQTEEDGVIHEDRKD